MFSHPRLLKCRQARISPNFLKPEMRKHRQGSNFPKIPKILASMGSRRAIVAQLLGILGKFDPCRCFRFSGFKNFGEICSLPMFSHPRLPTSHDPLLRKSSFVWIMGGGGREHIYIYIYIYIGVPYMNPHIMGFMGPGFLNQVPTLWHSLPLRGSYTL